MNEKLMPVMFHPKGQQNFGQSEDEKKEIVPVFIEKS